MPPQLMDPVAIRVDNPHTGEISVHGGLIVATHDINPEWNPDGDVVTLRTFTPDGVDSVGTQYGAAVFDDDGIWQEGYVTIGELDAAVESLSKVQVVPPTVQNPTTAGGGVTFAQVKQEIEANNATLLSAIRDMIAPAAEPAEATKTADIPIASELANDADVAPAVE